MAELTADAILALDPEMLMLRNNTQSGYNYQYRRYDDWTENYDLYRDKVQINRLTQRQTVNIPLMKQTIRTLLTSVDDMPVLYFENLDNDKEAELFKNEYWTWTVEQNKMELQDIVDKRQVMLFGRSFDQWQIINGKVTMTVQDPMDILVDRFVDPFNLHSSRFLIHTHIFRPLSSLKNNPEYDQEVVAQIEMWHATNEGLIKAKQNEDLFVQKQQKLADLGVLDAYAPVLGETYIELTNHFVYRDNEKDSQGKEMDSQIFLYVEAEGLFKLMKKPLEQVIGVTKDHYWQNHYPYNSWADDVERQDFWSDGVGDIVRGSNKILNVFYSQKVENRTLRSFGMNYYDASIEGFQPQTMQPMPFGWYGMPGKPSDVFQKVDIPDLNDSLDDMNFILMINEKASGATSTQQGVQTPTAVTLGEVQLMLNQAQERVKGMSKFYTPAWKERGMMFIKLLEAAPDKIDAVTIYKKGKNTSNIFSREIGPKDWQTPLGYQVRVWSMDEKKAQDTDMLNKLNAVKMNMPDNPVVDDEYKRKLLEFSGMQPDKIIEAMQFEDEKRAMQASMIGNGIETPGMPQQQLPAGQGGGPAKPVGPPQQPMQIPAQAGAGQ